MNSLIVTLPMVIPLTVFFAVAMSGHADPSSPILYAGVALMLGGWAMLIRSKWDQIRRGELASLGVPKASAKMRALYLSSYFVMATGWTLACTSGLLR